ncbi:MAG: RsmD family RNA methyltransferase [Actinobacteria bacterium]|nr:RsmD family RNA methyltransferase [Actinomycetota bacterium]
MPKRGGTLRIVAGEFGGRAIRIPLAARPTTERVRGAIFDALQAAPPARVLDCFAASGGLGIEALSRGAEFVLFVERSPQAAAVIDRNLASLGIAGVASVVTANALTVDLAVYGPFALALADPPYAFVDWDRLWVNLLRPGVLTDDALLVFEHSSRVSPPAPAAGWIIWKSRTGGDTSFTIYRKG